MIANIIPLFNEKQIHAFKLQHEQTYRIYNIYKYLPFSIIRITDWQTIQTH